jgi:hypothetical protein
LRLTVPPVIRKVRIEGFKRFDDVEFVLPGHIVVAGPNNSGKTTLLQAIAAWSLALARWKQLNDFQRHGGGYTRAPIARQAFSAVPLRSFDLLWRNRAYAGELTVTVTTDDWTLPMKFEADSTEQIYVRPAPVDPAVVRGAVLSTVFVPPMTGLGIDEPVGLFVAGLFRARHALPYAPFDHKLPRPSAVTRHPRHEASPPATTVTGWRSQVREGRHGYASYPSRRWP